MKMTTRSLVNTVAIGSIATLAMAFGAVSSAQAATLIDENFNGILQNLNVTGALGSNFTVTGGDVDVIGTNYDFYPGQGYGNYIDLNGGSAGTITSSTFNFNAGDTLTLSFDYGQNPDTQSGTSQRTADVFFGNTLITSLSNPTGPTLTSSGDFTFNAPTTGTLRFVSTNTGAAGIVLDNIKLTSTSSAVPEPSDFVGTAIAFGSVVMLKRNFGKKAK